jgi:hypothetical protein
LTTSCSRCRARDHRPGRPGMRKAGIDPQDEVKRMLTRTCCLGVALTLISCSSTKRSTGATDGSIPPGDTLGGTPCQRACAAYQTACGEDSDCGTACLIVDGAGIGGAGPGSANLCPKESKALFDCVATQPASAFLCDRIGGTISMLNGASPPAACADLAPAYRQCSLTNGQDCSVEATVDQSCAMFYPDAPRHAVCKVDVTPPTGCVPFAAELPNGSYCCP